MYLQLQRRGVQLPAPPVKGFRGVLLCLLCFCPLTFGQPPANHSVAGAAPSLCVLCSQAATQSMIPELPEVLLQ